MTRWRGKIRYGMAVMFLLLVVLVAGTYVSNRITEHNILTQQKAMIGRVYKQNPEVCEALLLAMFQEDDETDLKKADEALLAFGCTQDGIIKLYSQSNIKKNGDVLLLLQIGLAGGILFCIERFMRIQENQIEKQVDMAVEAVKKQTEKEIYVAKEMGQKFVENIAHQIKTPLACISLSLDMLQENLKEDMQKEQVQDTFVYLKQIEILMKRLFDIGRLESGKQMLQKEELSLEELIYSCVNMLDAKQERIVVDVINETETPPVFYGDYDWLKEAFCNILKNALEHDRSQSEVSVTLRNQKGLMFVQIKDYGEGIPQEDIKHIFDRFCIPNHAKKGHTGIGLNLAKLVVEKHFGTIEAVNHEAGGVQVSICFPLYGFKNEKI